MWHGSELSDLDLIFRAYQVWRDSSYMSALIKAANCVWRKGLLRRGPGLCHGVSGSGYVFLLLHRMTGDVSWLHRAVKFAEFLFSDQFRTARDPDNPVSLFEERHERRDATLDSILVLCLNVVFYC